MCQYVCFSDNSNATLQLELSSIGSGVLSSEDTIGTSDDIGGLYYNYGAH